MLCGVGCCYVAQQRVERPALAQQGRDRRSGNLSDRVVVIVAGEPQEPEILVAQKRGLIEYRQYAADPVPWQFAVAGMCHDQADLALLAERYTHARAWRRAESVGGRQIVEQS